MKTIKNLKKRKTLKRRKYNGGAAASGSASKKGSGSGSKKKSPQQEGMMEGVGTIPQNKNFALANIILMFIWKNAPTWGESNRYASHITEAMVGPLKKIIDIRDDDDERNDQLMKALRQYKIMMTDTKNSYKK